MFARSDAAERERFERHAAVRRARLLCPPRLVSVAEDRAARRRDAGRDGRGAFPPHEGVASRFAGGIDLRAVRSCGDVRSDAASGTSAASRTSSASGTSSDPATSSAVPVEAASTAHALASDAGAEDPLGAALALVEAAIAQDASDMVDAALSERLITCARLVDRVRVAQSVTAGPWQARGLHAGQARSAPCWLSMHADVGRGEAGSVLHTAKVVREHAVLGEMLCDGRLRFAHVEQLAAAVTSDRATLFARDVAVLARHLAGSPPHDAAILIRRWKALADDALASRDAADQHDRRRLQHSRVGTTWKTDALFDLDEGAVIEQALDAATDSPDDPDDPRRRTMQQRRADALVRIARDWLELRRAPGSGGGSRSLSAAVSLHVNEKGLLGSSTDDGFDPAAVCDLVPGGPVARSTARRLLCDSAVGRIVMDAAGVPIDLGRHERLFSAAQRRAMIARDGPFCVVPSCDVPADRCQAHHLDPFESGGPTDLVNGALVCNAHHHDTHDRGYGLQSLERAGHYRWSAPNGRVWTTDRALWGTQGPSP